jgi:hypothetical protein
MRGRKSVSLEDLSSLAEPAQPAMSSGGAVSSSADANHADEQLHPLMRVKMRQQEGQKAVAGSAKAREAFLPHYASTRVFERLSRHLLSRHYFRTPFCAATWIGFWALLNVTCATYVLTPMRDAIALQVGVDYIPMLTLASTVLAFCSSVPIGWLFEAPDPNRRRVWKRMGLTRGETQGSSLALFYRCFALCLLSYAVGFQVLEWLQLRSNLQRERKALEVVPDVLVESVHRWWPDLHSFWAGVGKLVYIAFFLVVHLMKLHSLSLVWGVTTEAMEYEEVARRKSDMESNKTRLQRLSLIGFGGTVGGIMGR